MRKNILATKIAFGLVLVSGALLTGCKGGETKSAKVPEAVKTVDGQSFPVAYVRMDSLLQEYQFAKDVSARLEKEATASQAQLKSKAAAFEKAAADFQRRAQINAFVSEDAAKAEQAKVVRLQQEVEQLNAQLSQKLMQQQALLQQDVIKEIRSKITEYNKDGKFKLILTDASILFADDKMDITASFLTYLNESYKPTVATDSTKTAKK